MKTANRLALTGILLLGFVLRLFHLGVDSLWYDETVSAMLAQKPLAAMWAHTALDIHPPLYYALLHGWRTLAGGSEFSLAFFSVWFGVAGIAMVAFLGRYLFSARVGLLAAFLMAINPFSIWYAQEVRMYTLGLLLSLLLLKFVWDFLTAGGRRAWVGYVFVAALLLWTLYYTAFTLVALNLVLIPWLWVKARQRLMPWLLAQLAVLVLYIPWLPHALHQALHPPVPPWRQALALGPLLLRIAREGATALALGQSIDAAHWWPVGVLALIAGAWALRPRRQRTRVALLWALLVGPVLLILLISQSLTPLYHVRYLYLYSATWPLLVAAGLAPGLHRRKKWSDRALSLGVLAVLLLGSGLSLRHYHTHRFDYEAADDLRGAVSALSAHLGPNDAILIDAGYLYPALLNYWPGHIERMARLSTYQFDAENDGPVVVLAGFVDGDADIGWGDPASDFYAISQQDTEAQLDQLFQHHNMVWLLRGYDTVNDPRGVIRQWLQNNARRLYDQSFAGQTYVRVQGWQQAPLAPSTPLAASFDDGIQLLGYDRSPRSLRPGQPLRLTLHWRAQTRPERSYKVFVHWLTADGRKISQRDDLPGFGALPTTSWPAGRPVSSNFVLPPPSPWTPGPYRIITGFYDAETGQALPLLSGETQVILWEENETD